MVDKIQKLSQSLIHYFVENDMRLHAIPRESCIRVVDRVEITPKIDYTIHPSEHFALENKTEPQYIINDRKESHGMKSYNEILKFLKDEVTTDRLVR